MPVSWDGDTFARAIPARTGEMYQGQGFGALRSVQENSTLAASPPWLRAGEASVADDEPQLHRRITCELHDLVVQPLTNTLVELDAVERGDLAPAPERARVLQRDLRAALHGVRLLVNQLRGQAVDPGDLVPRVAALVADVCARTGLDANIQVASAWPSNLAPETGRGKGGRRAAGPELP